MRFNAIRGWGFGGQGFAFRVSGPYRHKLEAAGASGLSANSCGQTCVIERIRFVEVDQVELIRDLVPAYPVSEMRRIIISALLHHDP